MSKVLFISDLHFGHKTKGSWEVTWGWQKPALERFLCVVRDTPDLKAVIISGDIMDHYGPASPDIVQAMVWFGRELDRSLVEHVGNIKAYAIPGNHDCINYQTNIFPNWVSNLWSDRFENLIVVERPSLFRIGGLKWKIFPWMPDMEEFRRELVDTDAEVIVGHMDAQGFKYGQSSPTCLTGLGSLETKRFKRVFLGHFHLQQTIGNISYVGSPYPLNASDIDSKRGYMVYDTVEDIPRHESLNADPFVVVEFENRAYTDSEVEKLRGKVVYIHMEDPSVALRQAFRKQLARLGCTYHERVSMTARLIQDKTEIDASQDELAIVKEMAESAGENSDDIIEKYNTLY